MIVRLNKKKGFTLLEILISTLIMAMIMAGLAGIFVAGKRQILHSRSKIQTAELGKLFLGPLQMQVRQDTWGLLTNALSPTPVGGRDCASQPGCPSVPQRTLDNILYEPQYYIDNIVIGTTNLRRVKIDITWDEPQ